ncbi:folate family ECF transporter S component [Peptostreptococcus russellii]|uniref:folate family ECF transporter S component n=1 Tax=Peptostreptococcus russellii TaxID=215200 RepID=UPI003F588ED9
MKEKSNLKGASLKDVRTLTGSALLIAIAVIVDFFRIVLSNIMEISFGFLAIVMAAMMYGPLIAGLIAGVSDIIQYIIRPTGPFFPGFTLNAILSGIIYGLFLYKKELSIKRISLCVLFEGIVITLLLTPIWLSIMYGAKIFAIPRVIKFIAMFPIKVTLIYACGKLIEKQKLVR